MKAETTLASPGGRVLGLPIVQLFCVALALAGVAIVATLLTRALVPPAPSPLHAWVLLKNLLLPPALLTVYAAMVRLLERRPVSELSGRPGLRLFPAGLALGLAIIGSYVGVLLIVGVAEVGAGSSSADPLTVGNEFLVPFLTAVGEELLFRAVIFRLTEKMFGTAIAAAVSAVLFGLSHAVNPGATPAALAALALGGGGLLAFSFTATRSLWLPIGLHMGWNLAEGFVFGLPNSGMTDPLRLLSTSIQGGPAWSGGAFGPEASALLTCLCLLVSALLVARTMRMGCWVPARCRWR